MEGRRSEAKWKVIQRMAMGVKRCRADCEKDVDNLNRTLIDIEDLSSGPIESKVFVPFRLQDYSSILLHIRYINSCFFG